MLGFDQHQYKLTPLFQLPIYGLDSASVESLSGHIRRLALAHHVTIYKILCQLLGGSTPTSILDIARNHRLNTACTHSLLVCKSLERDTGHSKLLQCTFDFLSAQIASPINGLLSTTRTWCDGCFKEDIRERGEVYDRLVWSLKAVSHCIYHEKDLSFRCRNCGAKQPYFVSHIEMDRCHKCAELLWKGNKVLRTDVTKENGSLALSRYFYEILQSSVDMQHAGNNHAVAELLTKIMSLHSINVYNLAAALSIPNGVLYGWINHRNKPRLDYFMDMCINLSIQPSLALTEPILAAQTAIIPKESIATFRIIVKRRRTKYDRAKLRKVVAWALTLRLGDKRASPVWIARLFRISMGTLYYHYGKEMNVLSKRNIMYRTMMERKRNRKARKLVTREVKKRVKYGDPYGENKVVRPLHNRYGISISALRAAYAHVMR